MLRYGLTDLINLIIIPIWVNLFQNLILNLNRQYIKLENLLYGLKSPRILDIKLGTRTFVEHPPDTVRGGVRKKKYLDSVYKLDPDCTAFSLEENEEGILFDDFRKYVNSFTTSGLVCK